MCFSSNFLSRVHANLFKTCRPNKSFHIQLRRRNTKNSRISIFCFMVTTHKLGLRGRGHLTMRKIEKLRVTVSF